MGIVNTGLLAWGGRAEAAAGTVVFDAAAPAETDPAWLVETALANPDALGGAENARALSLALQGMRKGVWTTEGDMKRLFGDPPSVAAQLLTSLKPSNPAPVAQTFAGESAVIHRDAGAQGEIKMGPVVPILDGYFKKWFPRVLEQIENLIRMGAFEDAAERFGEWAAEFQNRGDEEKTSIMFANMDALQKAATIPLYIRSGCVGDAIPLCKALIEDEKLVFNKMSVGDFLAGWALNFESSERWEEAAALRKGAAEIYEALGKSD